MRRHAFRLYAVLMVGAVVVAPVARAAWQFLQGAGGLELVAAATPATVVMSVAALWAAAFLAGGARGPALLRPFPTWVRASGDRSRLRDFGPAALRGAATVTAATTLVAGGLAAAIIANGLAAPLASIPIVGAGALVGVIASVAWLAGQALESSSRLAAAGATAVAGAVVALASSLTPVSATAAGTVAAWAALPLPAMLAGIAALALAAAAVAPWLLHCLEPATLVAQAVRAGTASGYAAAFEFGGALALYRAAPSAGRRLRAVGRHRMLAVTFARRDGVGALRSPWRLAAGIAGLVVAGFVVLAAGGFAVSAAAATAAVAGTGGAAAVSAAVAGLGAAWPLGAAAGMLAYAALGPLTDGVRHAAEAAESTALYGVGDGSLLALHAAFPLLAAVCVLVLAAGAALLAASVLAPGAGLAAVIGQGVVSAAEMAPVILAVPAALGVLALGARVSDARKGPMPVALLLPIPTEAGDLGPPGAPSGRSTPSSSRCSRAWAPPCFSWRRW